MDDTIAERLRAAEQALVRLELAGEMASARELFALVAADRTRVLAHEGMSIAAVKLFELLPSHPVVTVASAI